MPSISILMYVQSSLAEALGEYVTAHCNAELLAHTDNAPEALLLADRINPDVVIVEMGRDAHGLNLVQALHRHLPLVQILLLCTTSNYELLRQARELGVRAILMLPSEVALLPQALTALLEGKEFFCDHVAAVLHQAAAST
jgi:DNA-binding NarL/FixJ family response regulator